MALCDDWSCVSGLADLLVTVPVREVDVDIEQFALSVSDGSDDWCGLLTLGFGSQLGDDALLFIFPAKFLFYLYDVVAHESVVANGAEPGLAVDMCCNRQCLCLLGVRDVGVAFHIRISGLM